MAQGADFTQRILKETLSALEKLDPEAMKEVQSDPAKVRELEESIRRVAEEHDNISKEFSNIADLSNCEERLAKHLPSERVRAIREGLQIPTFTLSIARHSDDGQYHAHFTRDGKQFSPSLALNSQSNLADTDWKQLASILIEAIILVLSAVGITVEISASTMEKAIEAAEVVIRGSRPIQESLEALTRIMQDANSSFGDKAEAIFELIKATYEADVFMNLVRVLLESMSLWDWIKASGIITAVILAAFASAGLALIGKIALALYDAYNFMQKFLNLSQIRSLKSRADQ